MTTIQLSLVEQAYVNEIAAQASAAEQEIKRVTRNKLAVVLEAHGLKDAENVTINFDGQAWTLQIPDKGEQAPSA